MTRDAYEKAWDETRGYVPPDSLWQPDHDRAPEGVIPDRIWAMITPEQKFLVLLTDASEAARFAAMDGRQVVEYAPLSDQPAQSGEKSS